LGDNIPGEKIFAYITAVWMILAGAAVLWRRTVRAGALAAAFIYLVFGLFWLPRFYTAPQVLGLRLTLLIGLLAGMFTQLMVVAGARVLHASFTPSPSRWPQASRALGRWVIRVAAHLLALMILVFEIALVPMVFANPGDHIAWGSNAYSLAAAGAVWIFASSLHRRHLREEHDATSQLGEAV
jgi:hypothetical protein